MAGLGSGLPTPSPGTAQDHQTPLALRGTYAHGDLPDQILENFQGLSVLILFISNLGYFSENLIKRFAYRSSQSKTSPAIHFASYSGRTRKVQGKEHKLHFITCKEAPRPEYDPQRSTEFWLRHI